MNFKSALKIIPLCVFVAALTGFGDREIATIKNEVTINLKDPQSVQFRDIKKYSEGVICGSFNAKNAMGGYVGFSPFIFNGRNTKELDMQPRDGDISVFCNDLPKKRVSMAKREYDEELFMLSMFVENRTQCVDPKSNACKSLNEGKALRMKSVEEAKRKIAAAEASYK